MLALTGHQAAALGHFHGMVGSMRKAPHDRAATIEFDQTAILEIVTTTAPSGRISAPRISLFKSVAGGRFEMITVRKNVE